MTGNGAQRHLEEMEIKHPWFTYLRRKPNHKEVAGWSQKVNGFGRSSHQVRPQCPHVCDQSLSGWAGVLKLRLFKDQTRLFQAASEMFGWTLRDSPDCQAQASFISDS